MLQRIQHVIVEFLRTLRAQSPDEFNPISLTQIVERYSTLGISKITEQLYLVPETEINELLRAELIKQKAHTLKFGIDAAQKSALKYDQIRDLIIETEGIELTEPEIQTALLNPVQIVKEKVDLLNSQIIDTFLSGVIHSYSITNGKEETYINNPKNFVIAIMIINYFLNEISSPISHIANDYADLNQLFSEKEKNRVKDAQFLKYQIFTLVDGFQPSTDGPPRIYDSINDLTIFLCGLEDYTYNYLINLLESNQFTLSLKPSSMFFISGNFTIKRMVEHLEIGHYFDNVNLDASLI